MRYWITFDKDKMKQIDDSKNNKDKTKAKVAFLTVGMAIVWATVLTTTSCQF